MVFSSLLVLSSFSASAQAQDKGAPPFVVVFSEAEVSIKASSSGAVLIDGEPIDSTCADGALPEVCGRGWAFVILVDEWGQPSSGVFGHVGKASSTAALFNAEGLHRLSAKGKALRGIYYAVADEDAEPIGIWGTGGTSIWGTGGTSIWGSSGTLFGGELEAIWGTGGTSIWGTGGTSGLAGIWGTGGALVPIGDGDALYEELAATDLADLVKDGTARGVARTSRVTMTIAATTADDLCDAIGCD